MEEAGNKKRSYTEEVRERTNERKGKLQQVKMGTLEHYVKTASVVYKWPDR